MSSIQLRFSYGLPDTAVVMGLSAKDLEVEVEVLDGLKADAVAYLRAAGLSVEVGTSITFPVEEVVLLSDLSDRAKVHPSGVMSILYPIAARADVSKSVVLQPSGGGHLLVTWWDGDERMQGELEPAGIPTFLASDVAFVADEDAWLALHSSSPRRITAGVASWNPHDGWIEINAAAAQKVESAPLERLFRVGHNRYGLPAADFDNIRSLPGFVWDGPKPTNNCQVVDRSVVNSSPESLQDHLGVFIRRLASRQGQILIGELNDSPLFVLLALATLDALPALVVCAPEREVIWRSAFTDLCSVIPHANIEPSDMALVSYDELRLRPRLAPAAAIVFDQLEIFGAMSNNADVLASFSDSLRVGLVNEWPGDPESGCRLLNVIRPGEFELAGAPLSYRYPGNPATRAGAHAELYLFESGELLVDQRHDGVGPRIDVRFVQVPESMGSDLRAIQTGVLGNPCARLKAELSLVTRGSATVTSPKLAELIATVAQLQPVSERLVILSKVGAFVEVIEACLGVFNPDLVTSEYLDAGGPLEKGLTIVEWSYGLGDLSQADTIIVCDTPNTWGTLFDAVEPRLGVPPRRQRLVSIVAGTSVEREMAGRAAHLVHSGQLEEQAWPNSEEAKTLLERAEARLANTPPGWL